MEFFPRKAIDDAGTFMTESDVKTLTGWYNEEHRHYHNLEHINKIWSYYNAMFWKEPHYKKMLFTTIFHDSVYEIGAEPGLNEYNSAMVFNRYAYISKDNHKLHADDVREIFECIIATADHNNPRNDKLPAWCHIFLDLDLYELGSDSETYKENGMKIQHEYTSKISLDEYKAGRKVWARNMLERPIFRVFKTRENNAFLNLTSEFDG